MERERARKAVVALVKRKWQKAVDEAGNIAFWKGGSSKVMERERARKAVIASVK